MKKILLPALIMMFFSVSASADVKTHRAAVIEYYKLQTGINLDDTKILVEQKTKQLSALKHGSCSAEQTIKLNTELLEHYKNSYQNSAEYIIKLYTTSYTETELLELIKFYKSPLGQKFRNKEIEIDIAMNDYNLATETAGLKEIYNKYFDAKGICKRQVKDTKEEQ